MNTHELGDRSHLFRLSRWLVGIAGLVALTLTVPLGHTADWDGMEREEIRWCADLVAGNPAQTEFLDEWQAERCVDLLVDELARIELAPTQQRGKPLPPPPDQPPARFWHAFTSNGSSVASHSRLFMFGGDDLGAQVAPDFWYYSQFEGGWQAAPTGKSRPSSRVHPSLSCGAGKCVLAFGVTTGLLQDTWVYSEASESWTKVNCRRHFCPSARGFATMAYDPERRIHVLFGGSNGRYSMGDTHAFADGRWTSYLPVLGPYRRDRAAAVFVPLEGLNAVVMHGGQMDGASMLCDMFAWNGESWVAITADNPPCLHSHTMIWDEAGEQLVATGGYDDYNDNANTTAWYFRFDSPTSGSWTSDVDSDFASCVAGADPAARGAHDMATGKLVLFGGLTARNSIVGTDKLTICDLADIP